MKQRLLVLAAICVSITASAGYAEDTLGPVMTEVSESVVTVTAVDQQARTVTVQGQDGQLVRINVPDKAQNLDQVYPGARFVVRYLRSVAVYIRVGGVPPADVASSMELAEKGASPGGVITQVVWIQARVDAIDYNERTVVLTEGGDSFKLTVDERVKRLNEVKVGDIVWVGYTQAVAAEMIRE